MSKLMVLNIAHRGARSLAPENTMAAAQKALKSGADSWETDVGVSSDGVLILFHDNSLTRTTDAREVFPDRFPWTFATFRYADLLALDAGSWFEKTDPFGQVAAGAVFAEDLASYRGLRIPTLEEALIFTRDADWRINMELKSLPSPMEDFPIVERVLELIDQLKIDSRHLVLSSFNHHWLQKIRSRRPDIQIQALIGKSLDQPLDWGELAFETYNARYTLLETHKVKELAQKGVQVIVWPVNKDEDLRRFIAAGVAGIITDFPQRLARILSE